MIDFLKEMNKDCEDALNDQVKSFKIDFKKELYAKGRNKPPRARV
ncbi:hypothetical protein BTM408_13880 [Helicobacter pylori]